MRVVALAAERQVTYADAATTLQLSRRHASVTINNLVRCGYIEEVGRTQVDGARKPVPLYRAAKPPEPELPAILLLDWPR